MPWFLDGSSQRRREPWGATGLPLLPLRPKQFGVGEPSGAPEPSGTRPSPPPGPPAPLAALSEAGWNKRAFVGKVIISGALMGLAAAGEPRGDGCGSFSRLQPLLPGGRGSHHGRACLSLPHRPLLARRSHLGGRRLTPARGARGGGCCEEEGGGRKVGRNSDGDRNTKRERETAAETEKQNLGKRLRWKRIQSCRPPRHSKTASHTGLAEDREMRSYSPVLSASKGALS